MDSSAFISFSIAGVLACVVASAACARAAWGPQSSGPWLALAGAAVAWGIGGLGRIIGGASSVGGWPEALAFLAAAALVLWGVFRLNGAPTRLWAQGRTLVDGLIVAGSGLLIAWTLGLDELYSTAPEIGDPLMLVAVLAALVVAASVTVMLTRCRPRARPRLALIAGGFWAISIADGVALYGALGGSLGVASQALFAGWGAGWLLIGAAAILRRGEEARDQLEPGLPGQVSVVVPSVPFALAVLAAAAAGARGEFEGFAVWNGAAVIVLIVVRQVLALLENISYWRHLEAKVEARSDELRRNEARFRSLVQNSSDVITVIAPDGTIRYQSPAIRALLGYAPSASGEAIPMHLVHGEDAPGVLATARELAGKSQATRSAEFRIRHRDHGWRHVEAIASNLVDDPAVHGYVVNTRDITERKQLEQQLTHRAFHDPLTGLANRALFADRLGHALRRALSNGDSIAVLFLDLDDFKNVNDSLGHAVGDALLEAVAKRLFECVAPGDTVARLGGDEFAILLEQRDALAAARVADQVLAALAESLEVAGRQIFARASIGISTGGAAGDSVEELLRTADVAMYTAKERGKGLYEVFDPKMQAALIERLELEHDLRKALDEDQLELHYQPIVSLKTGRIRGLEALLRWRHPERGLLAPGRFIQLAEETGLVVPIGRWVLAEASRQLRRWQERYRLTPPVALSVNISARQLQDEDLIEHVTAALGESRLSPSLLILEITESVLVEDSGAAVDRLRDLRALGVRVAVDDFGTGYSSLSYLRRLPIDILKIDRAFLHEMEPGSPEAALAEAIVAMSRSLGLTPVAEGIERSNQASELVRMGCDLAQGYHFARPAPAMQVAEMLAAGGRIAPTDGPPARAGRSAHRSGRASSPASPPAA